MFCVLRAANGGIGAGGERAAAQLERARRHRVGHVARHHSLRPETLPDSNRVAAERTHHSIQVRRGTARLHLIN